MRVRRPEYTLLLTILTAGCLFITNAAISQETKGTTETTTTSTQTVITPAAAQTPPLSKQHSAIIPVPRGWWLQRHLQVNERVKKGDVDLLFIGDSITQGWETGGKEVWERYYGQRKTVNLGFSGDRTQHVLWRLDHGNIDGISPKAAVVMIGTNNSNADDNTAEEIADGIIAIVTKLRQRLPNTKILLLAVFPRGEGPSPQREKNAQASRLAAKIADGKMIHYLDIGPLFLDQNRILSKEIMPDLLHLSEDGYKIWAQAIENQLAEMLGDQPIKPEITPPPSESPDPVKVAP